MRRAVLRVALPSLLAAASMVFAATASAESEGPTSDFEGPIPGVDRPITTYEWVSPEMADIVELGGPETQGHTSNIIFLNRCQGGCVINGGFEDSRTNRSSIIGGTASITEWGKGDEQWEQLVGCVTAMYDPFDIVVTDVDPGNTPHFEAIVAGRAQELGMSSQIGGVAPFRCGVVNNAITFSFANSSFYANGIDGICETVAQETAHAFGLQHEYLCTDPMTYLQPCGYKWFQDTNASCGEYEPRSCDCGRTNQNSHRLLRDHFGTGQTPGPKMEFVRPLPNSNVDPNFVIEVSSGGYYYGVNSVKILVNGTEVASGSSPPYIFNAPEGLDGITTLEVKAVDARGIESSTTAEVNIGSSCSAGGCPDGRVCYKSFCIADASAEGGFGAGCENNSGCDSGICAKDSDGIGSCTDECELDNGDCPQGFGCLSAGASNVCWAGVKEDSGGCGCNTTSPGTGLAGMFLVLMGLMFQRRRRQR